MTPVEEQVFDPVRALLGRLEAAAGLLGVALPPATGHNTRDGAAWTEVLLEAVRRAGRDDGVWLLLAAVSGLLPAEHEVLAVRRALVLDDGPGASRPFRDALAAADGEHAMTSTLPVADGVVFDAGHTALSDLHTGIQRVVREVLRRWSRRHPVEVVAWSDQHRALRTLRPTERERACDWDGPLRLEAPDLSPTSLVLPWRSTVVLPELPPEVERIERLRALARFSGNRLVVVGYDAIPLTSAESVTHSAAEVFATYLSAVKHARRIVTISRSAAQEFDGFCDTLGAQGLPRPDVVACPLPTDVPPPDGDVAAPEDLPLVLAVGTLEPRKNQLAVLHAAEKLWRQGRRFRLVLLGGAGILGGPTVDRATELRRSGRPVELRHGVGDAELWRTYREARFTVFVSYHEGYGLPVAESLACGTPVLTTGHGSTGEVAEGGGAVLVDPRDEPALAREMARLLDDDALVARLTAEATTRPVRTWSDYAEDLWRLSTEAPVG